MYCLNYLLLKSFSVHNRALEESCNLGFYKSCDAKLYRSGIVPIECEPMKFSFLAATVAQEDL